MDGDRKRRAVPAVGAPGHQSLIPVWDTVSDETRPLSAEVENTRGEERIPMRLARIAGIAALLLAASGVIPVRAQSDEGLLRGVTRLDPFILPLDKDSETCGINESRIRQVLEKAAAEAPFGLDGRDYVLFVRLSSLPKKGDCFSSIDLGVYWEGDISLPESPESVRAKVKLWENGTILISPNNLHWREVAGILEHLVGNLIASWRADNDKHG